MMLPLNECYRADGVEVILVLDEPSEEHAVLETVKANPDIKFRVLVNDWEHQWRPPSISYNVGIRHALADHVVLADPESAIVMPTPNFPELLTKQDYRLCFAGLAWYEMDIKPGDSLDVMRHKLLVCEAIGKIWHWGNGFLLAPKIALERICGFDEQRSTYGLDDNDVRVRLARLGYRCVVDGRIKVFHAGHADTHRTSAEEMPGPHIALTEQGESWGKAFSRTAWSWDKQ